MAGGGTGGHITPNIALLEGLPDKVKNLNVLYVGSKQGPEKEMIAEKGWPYKEISCGKLRRYFSWENLWDFFRSLWGVIQSIAIISRFKPDVIFCKGGYVSLPVSIAGGILRKPVIIHESDLEMGLANRIAAYFARKICVSFPETLKANAQDKRFILTGNPVRRELLHGDRKKGFEFCGFSSDKKVLLVMGGSQGSVAINTLIERFLEELLKTYQIVHVCGEKNISEKATEKTGYFKVGFLDKELKDIYAITDIVIARAGANSLAEFEALGLPAILIPLVHGSRGDQIKNADSYIKNHRGLILEEDSIENTDFDLIEEIDKLSGTKSVGGNKRGYDSPAVEKIANLLIEFQR